MKKIIVDIYGADAGELPIIKGSLKALESYDDLGLVFVGNRELIESVAGENSRVEIIDTNDYITNSENPQVIFTDRDDCSIALGYKRLKEDEDCIGMISAGSTGALFIGSICRLGLIDGIKVPALSSTLPIYTGETVCLVDCGANIQCTAKDLMRFGVMGDAFRRSIKPDSVPKVALLSVGREDSKGTPLLKEAFALLKEQPINFIGNMEGNDLVSGYADVIVADGYAGNIILKATEAAGLTARSITEHIARKNGKDAEPVIKDILTALTYTFDYNTRGGATFLGTKKTVIKMHGCAVEETPLSCIEQLLTLDRSGFGEKIKQAVNSL